MSVFCFCVFSSFANGKVQPCGSLTLGNHRFDYDPEGLLYIFKGIDCIYSNIYVKLDGKQFSCVLYMLPLRWHDSPWDRCHCPHFVDIRPNSEGVSDLPKISVLSIGGRVGSQGHLTSVSVGSTTYCLLSSERLSMCLSCVKRLWMS